MFRKLSLGHKFNVLLLGVFLLGILLTGSAFAGILTQQAKDQVTSKALVMMETMNAVRAYTGEQVNPELEYRLATETEDFVAVTVPGYSAREVFENLRKNPDYSEFFYKEATLNPTNLRDKADEFETAVVERFRNQPTLTEEADFRETPAGTMYYIARPIQINQESCLVCHSTPDVAPVSMINTYGSDNGFGWQLNEIVGAQIVSLPANEVFATASQSIILLTSIVVGIFILAVILVNVLLSRAVIRPLKRMAQVADQVSTGEMEVDFEHQSEDEIGILAAAFNRMKLSLVMAMKMLNRPSTQN